VNKNEEFSKRKYDSIADSYDTSSDGRFTASFEPIVLQMCQASDGNKVLDVGCGNGRLINEISRKIDIEAFGVDISPKMIEVCKQRYTGISFEVSNGQELPYGDSSFDVLVICCALHHLNNPNAFFLEAQRVLVKNGVLIVAEPWLPFIIKQLSDWIVIPLLKAGDNKLFSHTRLKRLFVDSGFTIAETYKKNLRQVIKGRKL